jgi:hypothetical protein
MTTRSEMSHAGYGYADEATYRAAVGDAPSRDALRRKDVVGVLLAVTMILGPLLAGALAGG